MHWTIEVKPQQDEYGWFDYATSSPETDNGIFSIQHRKRAAPRFVETSIGPVCFEYEHVDREAILPVVPDYGFSCRSHFNFKNQNHMLDNTYKKYLIAHRLINLAILFVSVFVIATVIIYFMKHG